MRVTIIFSIAIAMFAFDVFAKTRPRITEIRVKTVTSISGPLYEVVIRNDGSVDYNGEIRTNGMKQEGRKTYRISAEGFRKIAKKIDDIGGEKMLLTDQPSTTITVTADGKSKSVEDSLGAPKGLYELEQLIFKTANLSAWLGPEPNFDDVPYYDYFPLNRRLKF